MERAADCGGAVRFAAGAYEHRFSGLKTSIESSSARAPGDALGKTSDHGLRGLTGRVRKNCTAWWLVMHARSSSLGVPNTSMISRS